MIMKQEMSAVGAGVHLKVGGQGLSKTGVADPYFRSKSDVILSVGGSVKFGNIAVCMFLSSVTHGCIVSTIKLFLPDGMEARRRSE